MAIEKIIKVRFVVKKSQINEFKDQLYDLGLIHLKNLGSLNKKTEIKVENESILRDKILKLEFIEKIQNEFFPKKQSFIENFIPNKAIFSSEEYIRIKEEFSLDDHFLSLKRNYELLKENKEKISTLINKIDKLTPLSDMNFKFVDINKLKRISILFLDSSGKELSDLTKFEYLEQNTVIKELKKDNKTAGFILIFTSSIKEQVISIIKRIGLNELDFTYLSKSPLDSINDLKEDLYNLEKANLFVFSKLQNFNNDFDKVMLFKDILHGELTKTGAMKSFASSKRVVLIEGYILADKISKLQDLINQKYNDIYFDYSEADSTAPVKLKNNAFFKPFEFIIRMFGFPSYGSIDPTPITAISFLILFGIAFGDFFYGLLLIFICYLFMKKYSFDSGIRNFFKLFYLCGISSVIFGLFTGSWFGDLISETYLPKSNLILMIKNRFTIVDPLKDVMTMVIIIALLGVINQLYGIIVGMYVNIVNKNFKDAFLDQFSWILFILSFFVILANFFAKGLFNDKIQRISVICLIVSSIFIFIGGFIKSSSFIKRFAKGILNIYGIMSSYGVSAIISDVLSYLRLIALAIGASSMAMSFNIVAFMFKDIKIFGPIMIIIILIIGHSLNFLLSILGAFVHPVRLVFYEFFGRFYSNGGEEFKPFSCPNINVFIKEEAKL